MNEPRYFEGHMRLSDWLLAGAAPRQDEISIEDATKTDRLRILNAIIGLPWAATATFPAGDIGRDGGEFTAYRNAGGGNLFALRIRARETGLVKARNRGMTIGELLQWSVDELAHDDHDLFEFEPHIEAEFSAIIVVNESGIIIEAARGSLSRLSRGTHDPAGSFSATGSVEEVLNAVVASDFSSFLTKAISCVTVDEAVKTDRLRSEHFPLVGSMIEGYFEVIEAAGDIYFVDYNRILAEIATTHPVFDFDQDIPSGILVLTGRAANPGRVSGIVEVVGSDDRSHDEFTPGSILVCQYTSPEYAPLIAKSAAVVTEIGGILSHAAILCRELGLPSIVGAANATSLLKSGDVVTVDGYDGKVWRNQ